MSFVLPAPVPASVPISGSAERFAVRRIYCVGRNYAAHQVEMGGTGREAPFFFGKPADALLPAAEGEVARMPYPSQTADLHHEVELVVAIGQGGRDIPVARALEHVWGYAVGLDMTRRDRQAEAKKEGRPWDVAKGFDHSAPIGALSPASAVPAIQRAAITLTVDGKPRQASGIDRMIWSVPEIIEHLSAAFALAPGDLIYTGTPEGVAAVVAGNRLEARIDGLAPLVVDII
ncbi:fumarylacetoacetate hydrolase family protein [Rivibacter subsaxonicus]|uniref:Fumarylpyruvate hydrolase n=1 Tax=Rivibacter subsaxonicus TaxID=457575 RepID=A0A4Q7VF00_9BURK|nr:fumarylacetoacetate hydrolase family protein [Rivibacter subsaxonicus]RZT93788.1 fumarylpyruvate hydrolase [Rivibacter subsaxonicus]